MEEVDYLGSTIRRWRIGTSTFLAWPERGARLMNWNVRYPDGWFRDVITWPELQDPAESVKARGGNPILFPFSARTFDAGNIHHWRDPSGTQRPMPMHGIARQGKFETTQIDDKGFIARFVPSLEARQAYPFKYDFDVLYRFREDSFTVEMRLKNNDAQSIPWSAGHHFYFNIPWDSQTSREDYSLSIPAKKACRQDENGFLHPVSSYRKQEKLDDRELVDRIHYNLASPFVLCSCDQNNTKIEIEIGTQANPDPGYALVTWTESEDSPFFCIEPWMGPPNSPEHEIGLHLVAPGEVGTFSVSVRI